MQQIENQPFSPTLNPEAPQFKRRSGNNEALHPTCFVCESREEKGHHVTYLPPYYALWAIFRFEALRGFSLKLSSLTSFFTCVAKLQDPFVHLTAGSQ